MAHALVASDTVWACHCRDAGLLPTLRAAETLKDALVTPTEAAYVPTREGLRPYVDRVAWCLREHYKFEGEWTEYQAWLERSFAEAKRIDDLTNEMGGVNRDTLLSYRKKLERYKEIENGFRSCKSVFGVVVALEDEARMYGALNDDDAALACFRKALAEREAGGRHTMTMSLTTTIGFVLEQEGQIDSALAYYNRSLRLAEESRDPVGTSRAYKFLALYYQKVGQYGTAYELLQRSAERCREFKGGKDEFYALLSLMNLQARMGIWESTSELLERSDQIFAEARSKADGTVFNTNALETTELNIGLVRGRLLAATGQEEEAANLFRSMRGPARRAVSREAFAQLLYTQGSTLLNSGKPGEAAALAREGLAYADSAHLDMEAIRLNLVLADAACQLGKAYDSKEALQRFRNLIAKGKTENRNYWMTHDKVLICLALASGDTLLAERRALDAMKRLEQLLAPLDQSVHACLFLDDCRPLREAIHEILRGNAEAGYGFEMAWRALYRTMGTSASGGPSVFSQGGASLSDRCALLGHAIQKRVMKGGAIHSVYFAGSKAVTCWTASASGVRREILPIPPAKMKEDVETVTHEFASHDGEGASKNRAVRDALTNLAALLPSTLRGGDSPRLLLVSPDLYLSNLPFEAINLENYKTYRPLIESHDVAYVRHALVRHAAETHPETGLVLVSPSYPPVLTRRYPTLVALPYAAQEAAFVTASFPRSSSLSDKNATKRALREAWEGPGFIYVVSHFIQDGGSPYITLLPLAAADEADPSEALLDYGDIRKANLSGCDLVVLSGCGTGAEYSNAKMSAPSLGDAFLDAGARAVVHTRWRVRDDESYNLGRAFITAWSAGQSPVSALNQAQRAAWRASGGPSTTWTSYSITLSEIPSITNRQGHASNTH